MVVGHKKNVIVSSDFVFIDKISEELSFTSEKQKHFVKKSSYTIIPMTMYMYTPQSAYERQVSSSVSLRDIKKTIPIFDQ